MNDLPQEIWSKIYEYDSTYVHCFNEVIDELKSKIVIFAFVKVVYKDQLK